MEGLQGTMTAKFDINHYPDDGLLLITMSGFFEIADIEAFAVARDAAHTELKCGPNQHLTLVDITQMSIQKQDAVAEFQRILSNPKTASKRIAFVVPRSLARGQIQRAAQGRNAEYFETIAEAEEWLISGVRK